MTELFQRVLGPAAEGLHRAELERIRSAFLDCREKAKIFSSEIARSLPDFTVHDINHLDALWEMADLISGDDYPLNPMEGFVLGCSFLVHDLAMARVAYPDEVENLIGRDRWRDTIAAHFKAANGRRATAEEILAPTEAVHSAAEAEILRDLHAEQATRLLHHNFRDPSGGSEYYLLSDSDLRNSYGELIGRIAASHWWPASKVATEFTSIIGAPGNFPRDWTVDPLKLACLLRVADAGHADVRRAPGFLRALREVSGESRNHWIFQERLQRPRLDSDRLIYTAPQAFLPTEAEAWWLCIDALRTIDRELRDVNTILADAGRIRFKARSVGYIDDIDRLSLLIPVRDWFPIDAKVKIGNVSDLVNKLGGKHLYGNKPHAALRELISNAADAIRARRSFTGSDDEELRLRIQISTHSDDEEIWLKVRDNGIGMTKEVMSGPLLDFGNSYWGSAESRRDLPGLLSSGFSSTGKFGIGFFSVFMLGQRVRVTSRRFDRGIDDSYVLTFENGVESRPLLRRALGDEKLRYGGTEIAVEVTEDLLRNLLGEDFRDLSHLCSWLCPTIDVDIDVIEADGTAQQVIRRDDWLSISSAELNDRVESPYRESQRKLPAATARRMMPIVDSANQIVGRAAIDISRNLYLFSREGAITVGGLRAECFLTHVAGVLLGETFRAARDIASPLVDAESVARWATEQVLLYLEESPARKDQQNFAQIASILGADVTNLAVADSSNGLVTPAEITEWASRKTVVRILDEYSLTGRVRYEERLPYVLDDDILVITTGSPVVFQGGRQSLTEIEEEEYIPWKKLSKNMEAVCLQAIGNVWGVDNEQLEGQIRSQNVAPKNRNGFDLKEDEDATEGDDGDDVTRAQQVGRLNDGSPIVLPVYVLNR